MSTSGDPGIAERITFAWMTVTVVEVSIVVWGLLAILDPEMLTTGFKTCSETSWNDFVAHETRRGLRVERLPPAGALNVARVSPSWPSPSGPSAVVSQGHGGRSWS